MKTFNQTVKPAVTTIVELVSRRPNIEDTLEAGFLVRDREVIELYSDRPLDYQDVKRQASIDGFTIVGIHEVSGEPEEF